MATVPGQPDNVTTIHPAFRPTQANFLQAAAITRARQDDVARTLETPEQKDQRERDELSGMPESARTPITPRGLTYGSRERQQYIQKLRRTIPKEFSLGPEKGEELEQPETYIDPSGRRVTRL